MQRTTTRDADKNPIPADVRKHLAICWVSLLFVAGCNQATNQAVSDTVNTPVSESAEDLTAEALQHYYRGESAAGFRLASRAHQLDPSDGNAYFAFTIGLLQTQQNDRMAREGLDGFRVDALDILGRRDEAFELAQTLAQNGSLRNLFTLFNRAKRSQELLDYLESRWSDLDAFSADNPHSGTGYGLMAQVALAYSRTGNPGRAADALSRIAGVMTELSSQGVNNMVFKMENAVHLALDGRSEEAISEMELAVDQGLRGNPALDWSQPAFESLLDYPRFVALKSQIADKVDEQRRILGLDPLGNL